MFDRFTDRARQTMGFAREEAQRLKHEYIGTGHILLGLIKADGGLAANVLKSLGVDYEKARAEVEKLMAGGLGLATMGQLPFTPRVKKALELALEESSNFRHDYIGTEHLILGLLKVDDGKAVQVLRNLGVKLEAVREAILDFIGAAPPAEKGIEPAAAVPVGRKDEGGHSCVSDILSSSMHDIVGGMIELDVAATEGRPAAVLLGRVNGYGKCGEAVHLQVTLPLFMAEFVKRPVVGWVLTVRPGEETCILRGIDRENVMGWGDQTFTARIRRFIE